MTAASSMRPPYFKKMKTKNAIYFCVGVLAGIIVASSLFFFTHYAKNFLLITLQSHGTPSRWITLQRTTYFLGSASVQRTSSLSQDFKRKSRRLFLPIVITSQGKSVDTFKRVQTTWGQLTQDWAVAIGDISRLDLSWLGKDYQNFDHLLIADRCQDLTANEELSSENSFCLLNSIYLTHSEDYDWFIIVPGSTYVAVKELNNLLAKLEAEVPHYIGKPSTYCDTGLSQFLYDNCISYCDLQHGVVLSRAALNQLVPHLTWCLGEKQGEGKQYLKRNGHVALGFCMKKILGLSCSGSIIDSMVSVYV